MKIPLLLTALLVGPAPASAEMPLDQAIDALAAGDLPAAEKLLVPLAAGKQPNPAAVHQLGIVRLRQQKSAEAVELAEKSIELAPTNADYHAQLGQALAQRVGEVGFMRQVLLARKINQAFEKAVELNPDHVVALTGLSQYYTYAPEIAGGSTTKAIAFARRLEKTDPYLSAQELGRIAVHTRNHAEALVHFEAAAALRPTWGWPHFQRGQALANLGRYAEARAAFEASAQSDANLKEAVQKALADLPPPAAGS